MQPHPGCNGSKVTPKIARYVSFYASSKVAVLVAQNESDCLLLLYGEILREFKGHLHTTQNEAGDCDYCSFIWGHFT